MASPGSGPPEFELTASFSSAMDAAPQDERVYRVALQLYGPTPVTVIAERADCTTDMARHHLDLLVDIGVLQRVGESPVTFQRNESYFEWRKQDRLTNLSTTQIRDRLAELEKREQELREFYDAEAPGDVTLCDYDSCDEAEEVQMDLSEWGTIRQRIRRFKIVR